MNTRFLSAPMPYLVTGVSLLGLLITACNRQPKPVATEAAMVAPPAAALPLAAGAAPPADPAPARDALPAAAQISYAPPPASERYGYIDQAYSMGQAFADTPPDYTVDYQGTRPWIWRSGNGAYRVVEELPQGERDYYYEPGQDQPFLVRDPEYSYAYDNGALVGVYGPDGSELNDALAAQRAYEASRYLARARELHRAALYEQRQAAYASAWAARRDQLRREDLSWQEQQARNADWRAWHDQHAAEEQRQWHQEQDQRAAYAAAIGLAGASAARGSNGRYGSASHQNPPTTPQPNPADIAQRQAAYFSNWNATHGRAPAPQPAAGQAKLGGVPQTRTLPAVNGGVAQIQRTANAQRAETATAQAKAAQAAHAQQLAAEAKRREAAAAQAKAAQAAHAQQAAATQRRDAAAAQAKSARAANAQQAAAAAQAAAQAKSARAANAQQAAAAQRREAATAQAKSARAANAQQAAAAQRREAAAAQAKSAQAANAQQAAAQAKQREAAAAQSKAAQASHAQQLAAEAKRREAAAAATHPGKPTTNNPKRRVPKPKDDNRAAQPQ